MQVTPENPVATPTHHSETKCARLTKIMITFCLFPVSFSKDGVPTFKWISFKTLISLLIFPALVWMPLLSRLDPSVQQAQDITIEELKRNIGKTPMDTLAYYSNFVVSNIFYSFLLMALGKAIPDLWEIINYRPTKEIERDGKITSMKPIVLFGDEIKSRVTILTVKLNPYHRAAKIYLAL